MKKVILGAIFGLLLLSFTPTVFARSGCCSWHDGVRADGCGCNDGTPLSSTCAPYYTCNAPQQDIAPTTTNTYTAPAYIPPTTIPTDVPTPTATETPTPTITPKPTLKPTLHKNPAKKKPNKPKHAPKKNFWQLLFGF